MAAIVTPGTLDGIEGRARRGGEFILDEPPGVPAVWGVDEQVLWAQGEPLMIVGPDGAGKTTLAQQLVLARLGLRDDLLGLPVRRSKERVIYLAADRPRQAARSFRRMVGETDRETLDERLVFWPGPLPFNLIDDRTLLRDFARLLGGDTLVIDSLKDVAVNLSADEVGSRVSAAIQELIAAGIEVCILHHPRKEQNGYAKPKQLQDVYGSRWLTAGIGSVVCLWVERAGDPIADLLHLKTPAEEVGPHTVVHDHARGETIIRGAVDLETILVGSSGISAQDAAKRLFGVEKPSKSEIEKARQRLNKLVALGKAQKRDDPVTGTSSYRASDELRLLGELRVLVHDCASRGSSWEEIDDQVVKPAEAQSGVKLSQDARQELFERTWMEATA